MLVQFLIENSAEIFGGDIASLFQRPDTNSTNSERSLGKLVAFYLQDVVKTFLIGELLMQSSLFLLHLCQRSVEKTAGFVGWFVCLFSLSPSGMAKKGESRGLNSHNLNISLNMGLYLWLFNLFWSFQTEVPAQEFIVALVMACPSNVFFQTNYVGPNKMVEWEEIHFSIDYAVDAG